MAEAQARVPIQVRETEWLRVVHGVARFVFRGDAQARLVVGTALGAPLPAVTGRAFAQGPCAALSLGPDEHLFIVAESEVTTFHSELSTALRGLPHSLVDVSHRQVSLELRGAYAEWLLAAACPLAARCRGLSGRRMYAHRVRQGRDRAVAHGVGRF